MTPSRVQVVRHAWPGLFVVMEGPDYGGKSTAAGALYAELRKFNLPVLSVKEPTSLTVFGRTVQAIYKNRSPIEAIAGCLAWLNSDQVWDAHPERHRFMVEFCDAGQDIIKEETNESLKEQHVPMVAMFLQLGMTLDRVSHYEETIIPALQEGNIVICDRSFPSTLAYAASGGIDWRYLAEAHEVMLGDRFIRPDVMFFFDLSVQEAMRRKAEAGRGEDHFEKRERWMRVRSAYHNKVLPLCAGFTRMIDAERSQEVILSELCQALTPYVSRKFQRP